MTKIPLSRIDNSDNNESRLFGISGSCGPLSWHCYPSLVIEYCIIWKRLSIAGSNYRPVYNRSLNVHEPRIRLTEIMIAWPSVRV